MHASPLQAYPNPLYTGTCAGVTISLAPTLDRCFRLLVYRTHVSRHDLHPQLVVLRHVFLSRAPPG